MASDVDKFRQQVEEVIASGHYGVGLFIAVDAKGNACGTITSLDGRPLPLHPLMLFGAVTQQAHALITRSIRTSGDTVVFPLREEDDDVGN